ncbi:hypothetical protein BLNAU_7484 [Blattamonas nauphoetae]|uniref:Uncharacterized protein n=1 Tax=Blattamonas nauphoetae TaxID=2049346 RepID=A0ABQ9Y1H1_9EUKA|nr:hypothetical protein BLNAU_7484 [Blattamonas nauphoetae]
MRPALNIEERGFFIVLNSSFSLASLSLRPTHLLAQITNSICSLSNCDLHVCTTSPFVAVSISVADRTSILGSEFGYVWNGIDGTIVRRFCHTPRFLAQNTTFRNGVYEEMKFTSPQALTDISNTFIKCNFSNCSSSSSGGSLLASYTALPSSIDLTLKTCKFDWSESDREGGALAIILDGSNNDENRLTVDIEHCEFSRATTRSGEGGAIFISVRRNSSCSGSIKI